MKVKNKIKLGSSYISENSMPYIIAEIGVNHECSMKLAKKMISQAATSGANAVKFQSYKAEKIASKNSPSYWDTKEEKTSNQYELFKKYDKFNLKEFIELKKYCRKKKIDFLSTPFDEDIVDDLDPLVSLFKIASADITNLQLLKKASSKGKPIILSTGASNLNEIKFAYNFLKKNGCKNIILLHCILNYPVNIEDANLKMITSLKNEFPNCFIGYSDHTKPKKDMACLTTAYSLGAKVIEKHFTYNKKLKGNDHYHSMDHKDLKKIIEKIKNTRLLIGNHNKKKCIDKEKISRLNARRSVYAKKFIRKNSIIKISDIICKRPGTGISPLLITKILGKKAKKNIEEDTQLNKRHF